jgi:phage terminase small subunit
VAGKRKAKAERGLNPKQQLFVQEYLTDLNATAAAERAGYKEPNKQGPRLLVNVGIAAAVAAAQQRLAHKAEIKAERVLAELAALAFSDLGQVLDFAGNELQLRRPGDIPESARRALASVKVRRVFEGAGEDKVPVDLIEFKLWDKRAALVDLGKHLGLWKERDPLEVLLAGLDAGIADAIRRALGTRLSRRGREGGGGTPAGDATPPA